MGYRILRKKWILNNNLVHYCRCQTDQNFGIFKIHEEWAVSGKCFLVPGEGPSLSSGSPCLLLIHLGLLLHGTGIQSRLAPANPDIAPCLWQKGEKSKQLFLWAIIYFYLGKKTSQVPIMSLLAEVGHVFTPKIYENQFPCWVQSNRAIVCKKRCSVSCLFEFHRSSHWHSSFYFLQLLHIQS